ncbi:MAG: L,D-transpeptidase family protein [Clostridiales bacterium]|nr:L,D-transpeptidase family protein [Clostridiales bacterium]
MKRSFLSLLVLLLALAALPGLAESVPIDEQGPEGAVTVTSEARALKKNDRGEDVKGLQTRLRELQYYKGPVTGNYYDQTARAVKAVQEAYGLEATGNADAETLDIIYGDAYRPLKKGDSGEDVKALQTRLSELGYYWGKVSGSYLDGTTAAISNFQKDNGMDSTGRADVPTQQRLYSDDIVMPTPDPAATPTPVPPPTQPPNTAYPGKLKYGSTGKGVETLQRQLEHLGYFDRKVTSGYYKHTQASVKEFQKQNGLADDGAVGEETWAALFAPDVVYPNNTPRPTPEPTPIPYFVEVDVANQLIKIFRRDANQEFTDLYKIFTASTGTPSFPSDVGTWTLTGRTARWAHFPTWGGGYAQYWTRINSSIAFHSFLYSSDRKNINMGSVNKLGRTASHGCIRLTIQDAKWIYDNIGKGVEVWIHEDAQVDPELKHAHRPGTFNTKAGIHNATPEPTAKPVYNSAVTPQGDLRELKVGSEGEDVFWLQSRLKELGLYQGTVTGQFREGTRDAVRAYQRANKLRGNGNADKKTLEFMYTQALEEEAARVQPTAGPLTVTDEVPASPAPSPAPSSPVAGAGN